MSELMPMFERMCLLAGVVAVFTGCDADGADGADTGNPVDVVDAVGSDAGESVGLETASDTIGETVAPGPIVVGPRACCLTMVGDLVVWSDDGDLFAWDPASNRKEPLVTGPGIQKDPILGGSAGETLIWADNRAGDFDLWTMQLTPVRGEPRLLRGGAGDQDQPVMEGTRLVWIGRDLAPHTPREAEVFTLDLAVPGSERQLTSDSYEQTQPDVSGSRIVWADFAHSPDAMYIDVADPLRNNADIFGWDLAADGQFIVTEEPTKQLRPAIHGETVVWLDWRGINPEPKYSEFQVFARRLSETGPASERRLAWSSWSRPELWRRPAISDDLVVFIAEPSTPGTGFVTGLLAVSIDGGSPWLVAGSPSVLDSVAVGGGKAAFVGAGAIGRVELRAR